MRAANDDFEGPLPVHMPRRRSASGRRKTAEAVVPKTKTWRDRLSDVGESIGDLIVPACFALTLYIAGFHIPS